MIGISNSVFRQFVRSNGADVAWTEMIDAAMLIQCAEYRESIFSVDAHESGVVAQLAISHAAPNLLIDAALMLQQSVNAVDINLGCPNRLAKRYEYGAYLLADECRERLLHMILTATSHPLLNVPLTAKIRLLSNSDPEPTVTLCRQLRGAGISAITIHGRTLQSATERREGAAKLNIVKAVIKSVRADQQLQAQRNSREYIDDSIRDVWLITNGNVRCPHDIIQNLRYTAADGIMVGEALLTDPDIFARSTLTDIDTSEEKLWTHRLLLAQHYLNGVDTKRTDSVNAQNVIIHLLGPILLRYGTYEKAALHTDVINLREAVDQTHVNMRMSIIHSLDPTQSASLKAIYDRPRERRRAQQLLAFTRRRDDVISHTASDI